MQSRATIDLTTLALPSVAPPRVGDDVTWYSGPLARRGELVARRANGRLTVQDYESGMVTDLLPDAIRLTNPSNQTRPTWGSLVYAPEQPAWSPTDTEHDSLAAALAERPAPGPDLSMLISEMWARGFETYAVGGLVRDVLRGSPPYNVDIVTTMPIAQVRDLLTSFYGTGPIIRESGVSLGEQQPTWGEVTLMNEGKGPLLSVSNLILSGADGYETAFGEDLRPDAERRDYTINALYYDPTHSVLLDPTGSGLSDLDEGQLRHCSNPANRNYGFRCKLLARYFRFKCDGLTACPGLVEATSVWAEEAIGVVGLTTFVVDLRNQIFARVDLEVRLSILNQIREYAVEIDCVKSIDAVIDDYREALLSDAEEDAA